MRPRRTTALPPEYTAPRMNRLAHSTILGAAAALAALACGCQSANSHDAAGDPTDAPSTTTTASACPFTPSRVRLHPLTRMLPAASDDRPARIDAHIELLDQWGIPVRALGELRFVARLAPADVDAVRQIDPEFAGVVIWNIDLSDPETNATRFYDRVTRTYHIALSDPALARLRSPLTLDVVFLAPGAATLPATATIQPPAPRNETGPQPDEAAGLD